jgi:hypothetical protein
LEVNKGNEEENYKTAIIQEIKKKNDERREMVQDRLILVC